MTVGFYLKIRESLKLFPGDLIAFACALGAVVSYASVLISLRYDIGLAFSTGIQIKVSAPWQSQVVLVLVSLAVMAFTSGSLVLTGEANSRYLCNDERILKIQRRTVRWFNLLSSAGAILLVVAALIVLLLPRFGLL